MAEENKYHVENKVFYHVFFSKGMHKEGEVIETPFPTEREHCGDKYLKEDKPTCYPVRGKSLFISTEDNIIEWVISKHPLYPGKKVTYYIAKLSLTGDLYWFDKQLFNVELGIYHETKLNKGLKRVKDSASKYWDSVKTTDELIDFMSQPGYNLKKHLFEGLFVGKAKVLDIKEDEYSR